MARKPQSPKTRIIKAAWNLFYKKGYRKTTIEDIITASRTSKGTFYHYFKSKEGLLNTLSDLFDEKYLELSESIDPGLTAREKLLYLNKEQFQMIEETISYSLIAYLYSAQLVTKDKRSLSDHKRFYFTWITEIIQEGLDRGEFKNTSSAKELMDVYAMFERALIYDWALSKGNFSLSQYSQKLLVHVLDTFATGI